MRFGRMLEFAPPIGIQRMKRYMHNPRVMEIFILFRPIAERLRIRRAAAGDNSRAKVQARADSSPRKIGRRQSFLVRTKIPTSEEVGRATARMLPFA